MTTCWKFTPGVVLAAERREFPPSTSATLSPVTRLGEALETVYSPNARLAVRAYAVAPGDELGVAAELSRIPNVLAASLNYLGGPATRAADSSPAAALAFKSGRTGSWLNRDKQSLGGLWDSAGVIFGPPLPRVENAGPPLVAVADPEEGHCRRVID